MRRLSVLAALAVLAATSAIAQPRQQDLTSATCPGSGCLVQVVEGQGAVGVQVTGTFVGTFQFEQTVDQSTWVAWSVSPSAGGADVTSGTGTGLWYGNVAGARQVRVRFSAYTSGTATVSTYAAMVSFRSKAPTLAGLAVDPPTFFVDSTNHRVGIGTVTPSHLLDVAYSANALNGIVVSNLASGTAARTVIQATAGTTNFAMLANSQGSTGNTRYPQSGSTLENNGTGAMNFSNSNNPGVPFTWQSNGDTTLASLTNAGFVVGSASSFTLDAANARFGIGKTPVQLADWTFAANSLDGLYITNTTSDTSARALINVKAGTTNFALLANSQNSSGSARYPQSGVTVENGGAGAMSFSNSAGLTVPFTWQTNGATTVGTLSNTGFDSFGGFKINSVLYESATAPTISSGFGASPSIVASNGTAVFEINVGTGGAASSGVIGFPAATTGWRVSCDDLTTKSATVFVTKQTAVSTTTATVGNFNTSGAAAAWVASDHLLCSAAAY